MSDPVSAPASNAISNTASNPVLDAASGAVPDSASDTMSDSASDAETGMTTQVSRGALWNGLAMLVQEGAVFLQAFLLPLWIRPEEYGLFAIAAAFTFLAGMLRDFSLGMKVVQDQTRSREDAFGIALTLELLLGAGGAILIGIIGPIVGQWKNDTELIWLIWMYMPFMFAGALALPEWTLLKDFRYRRRAIVLIAQQTATSSVMFFTAIVLDWGVWALVIGMPINMIVMATTLWPGKGYRAKLVWDPPAFKEYLRFGWPIWASSVCIAVFYLLSVNAIEILFGLAFAGYFQRMWRVVELSYRLNMRAALAIYPAIVRFGTDIDRLRSSFQVTNRLMMVLSAPLAVVLGLFAPDLVLFWRAEWADSAGLFQAVGTFFIFGTLAFDWDLYYRAKGNTQPVFLVSAYLLFFLPLFLVFILVFDKLLDMQEFGIYVSVITTGLYMYAIRSYYARKLLGNVSALKAAWKQIAAALFAGAIGFALHESLGSDKWSAIPGIFVMGLVYGGILLFTERKLFVFLLNALRGRPTGGVNALLASD